MTGSGSKRSQENSPPTARPLSADAAEFDYTSVDASLWGTMLDAAAKEPGAAVVLPVSWAAHEIVEGRFDFSSGSLGLRRLFELARARGVRVCLRIGGSATSPIDLPPRLKSRRAIYAQDARGAIVRVPGKATQFVPSAASTEGLRERMGFLNAVGAIVAEAVAAGLDVAVDCGGVLRAIGALGPFEADYHPAARALFWKFLEDRYGEIGELNAEYGSSYDSFSAVGAPQMFAPRAPGDLPVYFDWAAFQEFYRLWGVVRHRDALCAALGDVAARVDWVCVVPRGAVPISASELKRFFSWVAAPGVAERGGGGKGACDVAFAMPREYARLEWIAAARAEAERGRDEGEPRMRWSEFGFMDDVPAAARVSREAWVGAIEGCGVTWVEIEPSMDEVRRAKPTVVIVPTFDFLSVGTWRVMHAVAKAGGVVGMGPRMPWLSAALKPYGELRAALKRPARVDAALEEYRVGRGRIVWIKLDGAGDSGRSALRRIVRGLVPRFAKANAPAND